MTCYAKSDASLIIYFCLSLCFCSYTKLSFPSFIILVVIITCSLLYLIIYKGKFSSAEARALAKLYNKQRMYNLKH